MNFETICRDLLPDWARGATVFCEPNDDGTLCISVSGTGELWAETKLSLSDLDFRDANAAVRALREALERVCGQVYRKPVLPRPMSKAEKGWRKGTMRLRAQKRQCNSLITRSITAMRTALR